MSSLTPIEKSKLEKLFDMSDGYVWRFSNSSFRTFTLDVAEIDIHDEKYCSQGTSKANKFREFWRLEPDYIVGKVLLALIDEIEFKLSEDADQYEKRQTLLASCKAIASRLVAGNINLEKLKESTTAFDAKHLDEQIRRMEKSIQDDPSLAIGTAKELVETCCKTILAERGKPVQGTPDMPFLTKETLKALKLVPEGVPETARGSDVIKRLLQNLGTIGNGLAELRGLYGTGHGKHGKAQGLSVRHAKLAVGAASALVVFLFDTHQENK